LREIGGRRVTAARAISHPKSLTSRFATFASLQVVAKQMKRELTVTRKRYVADMERTLNENVRLKAQVRSATRVSQPHPLLSSCLPPPHSRLSTPIAQRRWQR
jgi:hypothetical protein